MSELKNNVTGMMASFIGKQLVVSEKERFEKPRSVLLESLEINPANPPASFISVRIHNNFSKFSQKEVLFILKRVKRLSVFCAISLKHMLILQMSGKVGIER